jgi:hypothetical protein
MFFVRHAVRWNGGEEEDGERERGTKKEDRFGHKSKSELTTAAIYSLLAIHFLFPRSLSGAKLHPRRMNMK